MQIMLQSPRFFSRYSALVLPLPFRFSCPVHSRPHSSSRPHFHFSVCVHSPMALLSHSDFHFPIQLSSHLAAGTWFSNSFLSHPIHPFGSHLLAGSPSDSIMSHKDAGTPLCRQLFCPAHTSIFVCSFPDGSILPPDFPFFFWYIDSMALMGPGTG